MFRRRLFILLYGVVLVLTGPAPPVCAQPFHGIASDSLTGLAEARSWYEGKIGRSAPLYRGSLFSEYYAGARGHPFFLSDDWEDGRILFNDHWYTGVGLRYDLNKDVILLQGFDEAGFLVPLLINQLGIAAVDLLGHRFVNEQKGVVADLLGAGFYDELYHGSVRVLAKRKKSLQQGKSLNTIYLEFQEKNRLFLIKEGTVYSIKSRGRLMTLLDDPDHALRAYLRQKGLRSGRNLEVVAREAALFHDQYRNTHD
jgi:hypothetical protein